MTRPTVCNRVTDYHVGPIEAGLGGRPPYEGQMLVDRCIACGYEWAVSWLPPKRREAVQQALAAKSQ